MSYYERMYKKASKCCDRVTGAKSDCEMAVSKMQAVLQAVGENWQGLSGSTYANALSEWLSEMQTVLNSLDTLEASMRQEAEAVLTKWPQESQDLLNDPTYRG